MPKIRSDVVFSPVDASTRTLVLNRTANFRLGRPLRDASCSVVQDVTGHINKTYIVAEHDNSREARRYVVQSLGTVFDARAISWNLPFFMEAQKQARAEGELPEGWKDVVFETVNGTKNDVVFFDEKQWPWRVMSFVPGNLFIFDRFSSVPQEMKVDAARALGDSIAVFGRILDHMPFERLQMPLPNFHNARYHFNYLTEIVEGRSPVFSLCQDLRRTVKKDEAFCDRYRSRVDALLKKLNDRTRLLDVLEPAGSTAAHGDTKITNAVFTLDEQGKLAVSAWKDLDTIQKGNRLDDLGDALRSAGNPSGEEPKCIEDVRIDTEVVDAVIAGYFKRAARYYSPAQIYIMKNLAIQSFMHYLYVQSMRFFADSLIGNQYWRLKSGEPQDLILYRAEVQMRALEKAEEAYGA